mmetsp:Transcript_17753/g.20553  ORF Transcript_17753/g.20553 Transcript_17753/m.20553 type:complete len:83 (+) Transcript_17753:210-458(+)
MVLNRNELVVFHFQNGRVSVGLPDAELFFDIPSAVLTVVRDPGLPVFDPKYALHTISAKKHLNGDKILALVASHSLTLYVLP